MLNFTSHSGKAFAASIFISTLTTGCISTSEVLQESVAQIASRQYNAHNWEDAVKAYTQSISQNGESYNSLFKRGLSFKKLGRYKEAISDFEKANTIRPNDNGKTLLEVSMLALKIEDYDAVIETTGKLLKIKECVNEATILRKQALFARLKKELPSQNHTVALADIEELIKINPKETSYKIIKARCLYELGSDVESREKTEDYMKILERELEPSSELFTQTTKMRAINLFYMQTPQAARKAKLTFDRYLASVNDKGLTRENAFWAGLIAKINLDSETQHKYWSRIEKSYIMKQINKIKK